MKSLSEALSFSKNELFDPTSEDFIESLKFPQVFIHFSKFDQSNCSLFFTTARNFFRQFFGEKSTVNKERTVSNKPNKVLTKDVEELSHFM